MLWRELRGRLEALLAAKIASPDLDLWDAGEKLLGTVRGREGGERGGIDCQHSMWHTALLFAHEDTLGVTAAFLQCASALTPS